MTQLASERTASKGGKVVYTAKTHTTGGREHGAARSSDGRLEVKLSPPGSAGVGTNPEQLFAAGWSACFESALGVAARKRKITPPADLAVDRQIRIVVLGERDNLDRAGIRNDYGTVGQHVRTDGSDANRGDGRKYNGPSGRE